MAKKLEESYLTVKPWIPEYELELNTAFELGHDAHTKLKQRLDDRHSLIFEDGSRAYIIT